MKTTKKHFDSFRKEVERLVQLFGLQDYRIKFIQKKMDENAYVDYDVMGKNAEFGLAKDIDLPVERCALHETMHLLLAEFSSLARTRFTGRANHELAEEAIVSRLENVLYGRI